jgi:hypothetical protein
MNQFIDFGRHVIARHLIRQVIFTDETTAVVEIDNGNRMTYKIDKASVMAQLNPPRSNMQYYTYTGNQ